jgi:hypothetical protein
MRTNRQLVTALLGGGFSAGLGLPTTSALAGMARSPTYRAFDEGCDPVTLISARPSAPNRV